jgi:poly(3-hydroxybutyrate) depolymerase
LRGGRFEAFLLRCFDPRRKPAGSARLAKRRYRQAHLRVRRQVENLFFFRARRIRPLPLIVLLHGSGRNGQIMVDAWKNLAAKEHFIVVAPDAYDSAAWSIKVDNPEFLHAMVDQVKTKHAVDGNRIYLFGHSSGAEYSLILAILDSHFFAATTIHAGALQPSYYKLFAYAGRRMPIAIWVGNQDPLFPLDLVTATKKEFESNGFPIQLSIIPSHDHNYYLIADEVNAKAWDFLKDKQLKPQGSP